jgi:PAS domain S-box-containing protein/diguanylate cyclase (GGDEF)-like protein
LRKAAGDKAKLAGQHEGSKGQIVRGASSIFPLRILVLEDAPADAELMIHELRKAGWEVQWRQTQTENAFVAGLDPPPEVILADYTVPGFGAPQALAVLNARELSIPLIVVTGSVTDEAAVECMKLGAADYLLKDRLARLPEAVAQALEKERLRREQERSDRTLRESERLKDAIIRSALDCLVSIDHEGRILEFNPAAEQTFGYKRADVLGKPMAELLIPPRMREAHRRGFDRLLTTGEGPILGKRVELSGMRADGSEFPIELTVTAAGSWDRPVLTAYIRDITERRRAENSIQRLNRVYAMLSGINSLIVRVRDRQELFKEACRIAVEHGKFGIATIGLFDPATLEVTPSAWAGIDAAVVASMGTTAKQDAQSGHGATGRAIRERRPVFTNDLAAEPSVGSKRRQVIKHGYRSVISLPLMLEDTVFGVFTLFTKEKNFFNGEEVKLLSELAGDISFALEHITKEEKLNYLVYYDALTGLPNRALFHEHLSNQLRIAEQKKTKLAIALIDVKRFRFINESLGRHAGDTLLREFAARTKNAWPDSANLAHAFADCFAGLLSDLADEAGIVHALKRLTDELATPFTIEGRDLSLTVTAGIAVFPADGKDADVLFRNAEAALKKAKVSGERYLFYQPLMNAAVAETLVLENKLRAGLEKTQFVLHYQPKIDLVAGAIRGVEALIRWNDPDTGLVPPGHFIPLLEESGMILDVGRWALCTALQTHCLWSRQGIPAPRVAVNVSAIQLRQKDFLDVIRAVIEESGAAPNALELEITESLIMEDIDGNIRKLRAVRDMGVTIAIDDFGTGYSSLAYLAKLPVNTLKIDRSFIVTMTDNPDSMTIVSTIISLAHALNLKVVAEGVELDEQSRLLKLLKCDEMQGYLLSRPLPAFEIESMLRSGLVNKAQ